MDVPLCALFECRTIADLAERVRTARHGPLASRPELCRVPRPERVPLSFAQERLWFIDQLQNGSTEYHIPDAFRLRGELDIPAVARAVNAVVARHEILRTHFETIDGVPCQIIEPELRLSIPLEDLSALDQVSRQAAVADAMRREWDYPFDLSRGPLLRVRLLKLAGRDHILLRTLSSHRVGWLVDGRVQ